jgi:hypothetical protein
MKTFTTKKITQFVSAIGATLLTAGISTSALAQANWPDRPVKLIVDVSYYQVVVIGKHPEDLAWGAGVCLL